MGCCAAPVGEIGDGEVVGEYTLGADRRGIEEVLQPAQFFRGTTASAAEQGR